MARRPRKTPWNPPSREWKGESESRVNIGLKMGWNPLRILVDEITEFLAKDLVFFTGAWPLRYLFRCLGIFFPWPSGFPFRRVSHAEKCFFEFYALLSLELIHVAARKDSQSPDCTGLKICAMDSRQGSLM